MAPAKTFRREVHSVVAILLLGAGAGLLLDKPAWGLRLEWGSFFRFGLINCYESKGGCWIRRLSRRRLAACGAFF